MEESSVYGEGGKAWCDEDEGNFEEGIRQEKTILTGRERRKDLIRRMMSRMFRLSRLSFRGSCIRERNFRCADSGVGYCEIECIIINRQTN